MPRFDFYEPGFFCFALVLCIGTAHVKFASGWGVGGVWDIAFEGDALALVVGIGDGNGGQESRRVGVKGILIEALGCGDFNDLTEVHDCNAVGDVFHDAEVVGDEQVGEVEGFLEVFEEVDDLSLYGHVEGGDGFVGDDEFGVEREGAGNADALALSSRKGMGISPQVIGAQAHANEQLLDAAFEFSPRCDLVDDEGFGHNVEDGHARVERGERILEDVLQFSPQVPHVFFAQASQVELLAVVMEDDLAVGGFYQADDGPSGCGLTAARFADQAEGFSSVQGEV